MLKEVSVKGDTAQIGSTVLIKLYSGLDGRGFGSDWRMGTIVSIGPDVIVDDTLIELDGGLRVYQGHIEFMSVLDGGQG